MESTFLNAGSILRASKRVWLRIAAVSCLVVLSSLMTGCASEGGDAQLTRNTYVELVDWHISGLWVINCPVAWVRVANYNSVPIKNIKLHYQTFDSEGKLLSEGTYIIEDEVVPPGTVRNFIERYLGLVDLASDKLSVRLESVSGV